MNERAFFIISTKEARKNCAGMVSNLKSSPLMSVEIKEYKKNRSTSQNRLMWAWYKEIAKHTGEKHEEDIHEEMKVRVLGVEEKEICGEVIRKPKSTKDLSVNEMADFLHAVESLAARLGIGLPNNDDYAYAMMYEK